MPIDRTRQNVDILEPKQYCSTERSSVVVSSAFEYERVRCGLRAIFIAPIAAIAVLIAGCSSTVVGTAPRTVPSINLSSSTDTETLRALAGEARQFTITSLPNSGARLSNDWGGIRISAGAAREIERRRTSANTRSSKPLFLATATIGSRLAKSARTPNILSYSCLITIYGTDYGTSWNFDYATEDCWYFDDGFDPTASDATAQPSASGAASQLPAGLVAGCANADNTAGQQTKPIMSASNNSRTEYAGFIAQSNTDGSFAVTPPRALPFNADGRTVNLGAPPTFPGFTIVAYYHTHPNYGNSADDDVDIDTHNHFSLDDQAYASGYNIQGYVAVDHYISDGFKQTREYRLSADGQTETPLGLLSGLGC